MDKFMESARKILDGVFGESVVREGAIRVMAEHLGLFDGKAVVEMNWVEFKEDAENAHPVLQFYSTLAQNIDETDIQGIKADLFELNTTTMLGYYGYFKPLGQIYHCYRMPVSIEGRETALSEVEYAMKQIRRQLDTFIDYVLFVADQPGKMTVAEYLAGTNLDKVVEVGREMWEQEMADEDE